MLRQDLFDMKNCAMLKIINISSHKILDLNSESRLLLITQLFSHYSSPRMRRVCDDVSSAWPSVAAVSCLPLSGPCLPPSGFLAHNGLTGCLATSEEIVSQQQMSRIPSHCKQSVSVSRLQVFTSSTWQYFPVRAKSRDSQRGREDSCYLRASHATVTAKE